MRLAVPLILQEDLATSRALVPSVAKEESGAYQLGATQVLRTTVETRRGRISIDAALADLSTERTLQAIHVEGASSDLISAANALAKQIDEHAAGFPTRNIRALQAFAAAAESTNSAARVQMLDEAVSVDPDFGLGYIALAETITQTREQDLGALLRTAANHRNSFTPLDRARFNALAAQVTHAPLQEQEKGHAAVLQVAPNNVDALVALGSARFLQGDANGGARLLNRALELSPGNANISNQLAQGLLETRRFAAAEKIFLTLEKNASVLPELAVCALLEGDERRANAIANKFAESLYPNVKPAYRATWLALSGHIPEAIRTMEMFKDSTVAALQIAIWELMQRDFGAAKKNADFAAHAPGSSGSIPTVAMLLSQSDQPVDEWREKVSESSLNDQAKQTLLGYGFFLRGRYSEASDLWQKEVQDTGGADLRARAMLASSLDHAGKTDEARKILVQPFVPEFGDLYTAISFREMRRLLNLQMK